ncbi:MAG: efflux RND transporter permease subunit [Deltaproteobacteria bacterium]|nr:efflux RND transporter permease subunit [Deltaproteobacteria bacterium]
MSIVATSAGRPIGVGVFTAAVIVVGVVALDRLPVDLLPEVDFPRISIVTRYPGVGPEEVENLVTRRIEQAVSTVDGAERIEGLSGEGISRVQLQFDWGTNLDAAVSDVRALLDELGDALPPDATKPNVLKFDISAVPIATLGLSGAGDPRRLRLLADELLSRRLERIPGIASVEVRGGRVREIRVELDHTRMAALGVTADQIVTAIARDNANVSAGDMVEAGREVLVRALGERTSPASIGDVLVTRRSGRSAGPDELPNPNGRPVYVRDVASVSDTFQEVEGEQFVDGAPGIVMRVSKQSGANTVDTVAALEDEIARINDEQDGRLVVTVITESAKFIESSIDNVRDSVLLGAGLAVLIMLFFLRDIRATLVVTLSIPFSVMATFALMYFAGLSLNLISFGGLALGVGMLVDNAISVLEIIFRKHEEERLPPREAAIAGAREILPSVVSGTLTTMVVFAPVVFLSGFAGVFFTELALVVVFALACSLLVAVTLVPALAALLIARRRARPAWASRVAARAEGVLLALERVYARALAAVARARWYAVALSLVLLAGAARLVMEVDVELMPETDEGLVDLDFELPIGTPVERTKEVTKDIERRVTAALEPGEFVNMVSSAGPEDPYRPGGSHEGEVEVMLAPVSRRDRSATEIMAAMRKATADIPGARIRIRQRTTNFLQRLMRGSAGERLVVEVRGHDLATAAALAERVEAIMKDVPGIADVRIGRDEGLEERTVVVRTAQAADLGVQRPDVARALETYVLGRVATRLRDGGEEHDVRVVLREADRAVTAQLGGLPIITARGLVPLSAIADVGVREGPGSIAREGQERVLRVQGGLGERPLQDVVADVEAGIATIERPAGFQIVMGGELREQAGVFSGLGVGALLAVLLAFAVMAVQFESVRHPLVIMAAIPFGAVGVSLTLVATGTTFNLNSFLGCIVLVGIAVNNIIMLVDTTNLLRRERAMEPVAALVEAGRRRLRPILMTTMTTMLGMLPVAIAGGEGSEVQGPLARVVLGGLFTSTFITLFVVPALYLLTEPRRARTAPAAAT